MGTLGPQSSHSANDTIQSYGFGLVLVISGKDQDSKGSASQYKNSMGTLNGGHGL